MADDSTLRKVDAIVEPARRVSLLIYSREGAEIVQMQADHPIVIGRVHPANVAIADMSLSRQHARFELQGDRVLLEDLDSTNGTVVNGKRVKRVKVGPEDRITLGAVTVTLHVMAPTDSQLLGLDSHERFLMHLEYEVNQAKFFGRTLALLMVQSGGTVGEHVGHWYPRVRGLLRPVDRVGIYGPSALLVCMPGAQAPEAVELAQRIARQRKPSGAALLCGIALFPQAAVSVEELIEVSRVSARRATEEQPVHCQQAPPETQSAPDHSGPVVHSPAMKQIFDTVERLARSNIPVLIQGATGVGKEVVARAIHERSDRRASPLRCMNCGAIPTQLMESALFGHERGAFTGADRQVKGVFEEADGGTVLLDEIGELSPAAQAALLRVLESKQICRVGSSRELTVDVRILAATNSDLEAMCKKGSFRWDLLYRLNTMTLRIPSLAERPEDIVPLAGYFLRQACGESNRLIHSIAPRAMELLVRYPWPGNVRELRNVIERAVVVSTGDTINELDLSERLRPVADPLVPTTGARADTSTREISLLAPDEQTQTPGAESGVESELDFKDRVREFETRLIVDALRAAGGNQTEAARRLKMPLRTLVHKIKAYSIRTPR